ncbi:dabb-domain-containing protein [Basidiobolus meristosporus CBS 931.73]|uniref:Dabb-domain-containing protein n=1 Tax=Basidiobolus meristosporus CBS 931.73 TaxID=1314790 RepID=A0A1Y1XCE2_9FUNG|nr:dabb-domain-containing protein [Basidiobolus meristosporus CBS 931.73]|eukprot:ORX83408.1 dabb-domain-containing protein [Basidiobolus meristosporus CBS 931.73]
MTNYIEHVLFLTLEPMSEEAWEDLHATFMAMKGQVPGIVDLSIGKNISPERAQGCTHALRVLLEDQKALTVYADHPAHVLFKNKLRHQRPPICLDWNI